MYDLLKDNYAILVRWDQKGNLEAWIIEPPLIGDAWPVWRSLAGISCYKATSPNPLLALARWIILVCCGREHIESCDVPLMQKYLEPEKSPLWLIHVAAVRGFVEGCQTPEMDLARSCSVSG